MNTKAIAGALGAAMLGACLGLCQGSAWAWAPAQLCLVLFLLLIQQGQARCGGLALQTWLFGMAYGLAGLAYMPLSLPGLRGLPMLAAMSAMMALHATLVAACAAFIHRLPLSRLQRWTLLWPAAWTLLEWLQSQGDYAVAWLTLGQLQAPGGPFAGLLPLGGVQLSSLAMWMMAGLLAEAVHGWLRTTAPRLQPPPQPAARRRRLPPVLAAAALALSGWLLGQLSWTRVQSQLDVVLVQALSEAPAGSPPQLAVQAAQHWQQQLLTLPQRHPARLILTPQATLHLGQDPGSTKMLATLDQALQAQDADLLLGAYVAGTDGQTRNSAMALGVSGHQRYDKQQLLPFAEFLPVWLRARAQASWTTPGRDLEHGTPDQPELVLGGRRVAPSICFELAFPEHWRQSAANAEVLINVSSDAAHPSARMAAQSLQLARARALEFGKPVVRTSDWAGSFVVDAEGRLLTQLPEGLSAEVKLAVPARNGVTPYARFGSGPMLAACLLLLACVALGRRRAAQSTGQTDSPQAPLRPQRGQVMLAALGLLLMTVGMMYLMVNTGQAVTEKMRVTNAADAAAYSAGVVEARALNYDAYLNRAIVANEIAIAQMVSLASWVRYFTTAVDNIGGTLGEITFFLEPDVRALMISATFAGAKYGLSYLGMTGEELADWIINYGVGPIVTVHDAVVMAMSLSQEAVHLNLLAGIRQQQIANDVASEMDPKLKAQVVLTSHGFDTFTKRYAKSGGSGDERGRLADVVTRSRDDFTRERNWSIEGADILAIRKDGALKKRGGTDLIGYDEWRGVDTLELHGEHFGCGKWGLSWCGDVQTSIGWGGVNVNAGDGDAGRGHHGNAYAENRRTAGRADSEMSEPSLYHFSGLPGTRELKNLDPKADISTGITILVAKEHKDTLTSGGAAVAKPAGRLALFDDKPSGGKLMALSRAQVYFDRISARADGKTEIGSLYNPYWRVRLVAPTTGDKAYAAAQQGGMALP
ncbi:MAG TPA: apolipoprotein N-acyltransferase [Burkholderiaceae bacterium]|nr:apolipoprotein N-acyltransferase [Burkholderiaceae bacterium]